LKQFATKEKVIGKALTDAIIESQEKQSRLGVCPRCGGTIRMHRLWTTKKRFAGCTGYPKCDFSAPLPAFGFITPIDKVCEQCKTPIVQVQRPGFGKPFRMCLDIHCPTKKDWFQKSKLSKFKKGKKAEPSTKAEEIKKED
jgi:DNA topoisomerase-1